MSSAPTTRRLDLVCFGLVTLTLTPLLFLSLLAHARTGKDLSSLLLAGAVVFLGVGACLVGFGCWRRRGSRVMGGVALLVSAGLSVFAGGCGMHWIGSRTAVLTVTVVDDDTGQPIPDAAVRLFRSAESEPSTGRTDADGKVDLSHDFWAIGTDTAVQQTGIFCLSWETVRVDAEGYRSLREPLDKYAGMAWDLYGPPLPAVQIRLRRKKG